MKTAFVSVLAALSLTGCATFGQKPAPVGEPGLLACISAQAAQASWAQLHAYMEPVLANQTAFSCVESPAPASLAPVVPPLR